MAGKIIKNKALRDKDGKELEGQLARVLADYDNLIKRFGREKEEVVRRATKNLVEDLLPVIDNFERASNHLNDNGLNVAIVQIKQILAQYGVEEVATEPGDKFDSNLHEAVEIIEGLGEQGGTIAQVLARGYKWKDEMIIRPAKVKVYGGKHV